MISKNKRFKLKSFSILFFLFLLTKQLTFSQDRHFWDQAVGSRVALLGGMVVGGVRDYSATFYNPGALGFVDKDNLNFNFSAYGIKSFTFKNGSGFEPDPSYVRVSLFPSSLAGGLPFIGDSLNKFSYLIYGNAYSDVKTSARYEGYKDIIPTRPSGNLGSPDIFVGDEFLINQWIFQSFLQEVTFGVGWGRKINDNVSIGATFLGAYRDQTKLRNETYNAIDTASNRMASSNVYVDINYFAIRIFGKLGIAAQWKNIKVGAALTLPSIHLLSGTIDGASLTSSNVAVIIDSTAGTVEPLDIFGSDRQEDISSRYRSPFSLSAGLEYQWTLKTKVNFSLEWFAPIDPYVVIQPKSNSFLKNIPVESELFDSKDILKVYDATKGLINFGFGVEHKINDMIIGYIAFRTDFSNAVFEKINGFHLGFTDFDIYHFTLGGSTILNNTFIGIGLEYSFGVNSKFEQLFNFSTGSVSTNNIFLTNTLNNTKAVYNNINIFFGVTQLLGD